MRLKQLLQNAALLVASFVVTAGLIEAAARLYVAKGAVTPAEPRQRIAQYHQILGWDKPPGGHMQIARRGEYDVKIALNAHGLRGPDRAYAKPAGTRRVLILGDSFGEGYYVDEEKSARAVLEELLGSTSSECGSVEVINGSTAGYSTDQEYLFFESEGHKYHADLVLVFFYYNDLFFNTTGMGTGRKPKPFFELDGDRLVLKNTPVPRLDAAQSGTRPFRGSQALRLLSNRVADGSPRLQAALAKLGLVERRASETNAEFAVFGPMHGVVDEMWRRTAAILRALAASVTARGAQLAVVYVPARVEANDTAWQEVRESYALGPKWDRARVRERLGALCESLGVPFVDPAASLTRAERSGRAAYFPIDGHWNELGNATAAHVLEPRVRQLLACAESQPISP